MIALLYRAGGLLDRGDETGVGAAATNVAAERADDVLVAGIGIALEQGQARHDHAGGAVAALQGVGVEERLLQGVQPAIDLQALDRLDLLPGRAANLRDAG